MRHVLPIVWLGTIGIPGLFAPSPVHGQTASATLSGTVTDETGARLSDAAVTILNVETALARTVRTGRDGSFVAPFLPPGRYVVSAQHRGFAIREARDIVLNVNDQVSMTLQLKVQDVGEEVTIVGEPSRASVTPGVGTVVDRQFVSNIPLNGRSLQALLQLVPGVVLSSASGGATGAAQFSVNGQRTSSNTFTVDGVSANTGISVTPSGFPGESGSGQTAGMTALGGTSSLVSLDALQEFRIETSTFAPEFGRTPGGQVMLVTRSGTNMLHGSGAEYFRHDAMDANDWFANSRNLPKPKLRQHLFSATLGGPVLRNRAFFFASYEGLRLDQPRTGLIGVPTVEVRQAAIPELQPYLNAFPLPNRQPLGGGAAEFAATYTDPASQDVTALRLDGTLRPGLTGFIRVSHAPSDVQSRTAALSSVQVLDAALDTVTIGATSVVGSRITADVRVNWSRNRAALVHNLDTFGGAVVPRPEEVFQTGRDPSNGSTLFGFRGTSYQWGVGNRDTQRQFNLVGTAAYVAGAHQVKLGVDFRKVYPRLVGGRFETLTFSTLTALQELRANYHLTDSDVVPREPVIDGLSLYAQDAWQLNGRLTLTYGLRFERVPPPREANGRMARTVLGLEADTPEELRLAPEGTPLWRSRAGELAPRVGAAWQLSMRSGWESTVRGGFGVFYDLGLGQVATSFHNVYPFFASKRAFDVPFPLADSVKTPPSLSGSTPQQLYLFDPNLRMPYTRQWHASWEQALGPRQSLTVAYVGAAGRRLLLMRQYRQPLAEWPTVPVWLQLQRNHGESAYQALQLQYQRRLRAGLQVLASYALSRARDNGSSDVAELPPADAPELLELQWAPSDFDARHVGSVGVTYDLPYMSGPPLVKAVANGWGVDLLLRAQSGFPLTVWTDSIVAATPSFRQRADFVPGQPMLLNDSAAPGGQRINPDAFALPPTADRQGTSLRNGLRSLGASQVDLAVRRVLGRVHRVTFDVRAELFNLLNHPNFGPFADTLADPRFGRGTMMRNQSLGGLNGLYQMGGPRSGQLALRVQF